MPDYNADEIDRLVREGREDDERMTPGPWKHDAGPGCRSIKGDKRGTRRQAQYRQVAFTVGLHDDEEDAANAAGIARTRNNLAATVSQLSAAKAEVERLTAFAERIAERDCTYGDGCPRFGSRHYRCDGCVARDVLGGRDE